MEAQGGNERKGWEGGEARERGRREWDARGEERKGKREAKGARAGRQRGESCKEEILLDDGSLPGECIAPLPAPQVHTRGSPAPARVSGRDRAAGGKKEVGTVGPGGERARRWGRRRRQEWLTESHLFFL